MRPTLTLTALLALIVGPLFAADKLDPRATTIHLDKKGNIVSIAPEGDNVLLLVRESGDPFDAETPIQSAKVRLSRPAAHRLSKLLRQLAEEPSEPSARAKAPWLHLTAARQPCDGDSCRAPARAATRRNLSQPAAPGYSRPRFARRVLGRVFGRCGRGGCCQ